MALPRGDEYNEAVQSPRICFSDPELQYCQVQITPLGLPKPYSGGFTTTYKLSNGNRHWAARCFTREIKDLQLRYSAIGRFIQTHRPTFLVDASFLSNGIKIRGNFHPIIKMKWQDGEPLNFYLEKILYDKPKLENTANELLSLVQSMERYGIAHGDLQHGNIIVQNGKLYLIDYDGMYFPELSHLKVNELGHPNYQHPKRTAGDYNSSIDRFAAMVIYTGIKALSVDPSLWGQFEDGENILFKGKDLIQPSTSPLFQKIKANPSLSQLANNLAAVCSYDFRNIPTLSDFINRRLVPSSATASTVVTIARSAYQVLDASSRSNLMNFVGQRVEVVGKLSGSYSGSTRYGDPYYFLNVGWFPNQTFTVVIWSDGINSLSSRGMSISTLKSSWISITGVLSSYDGRPQMILESPSQVRVLSGQEEAKSILNPAPIRQVTENTYRPPKPSTPSISSTKPKPAASKSPEDILNDLYKNMPHIPAYTPPTPPKVSSRPKTSTSASKPYSTKASSSYSPKPSTTSPTTKSTNTKQEKGCTFPIIAGIILGFIIAGTMESFGGFLIGFGIGSIGASWLQGD